MPGTWLPLFPLNVVLFPRSALPLHIFEERYKVLVNECVERGTPFGISLVKDEGMAGVGCTALVSSVTRRYEDGRMDIVVGGEKRYRLVKAEPGRAPYLMGEVEFMGEPDEIFDSALAAETAKAFNAFVDLAYKGKVSPVAPGLISPGLSFVIAQKAGLDLSRRQELLEIPGENARLRMLNDYLTDIIPRLKRAGEVQRVIKNDGYL